ncbi:MAG: ribonuclease III, partial [Acidimicrobiales bacterium]
MSDASAERAPAEDGLRRLSAQLGYDFAGIELLAQALTHRSWCAEHVGYESNERLEFLGDAVLGLVVTDYVYAAYPDLPEGALAKVRAAVVSSATLADLADEVGLGPYLLLGKGELATGGRGKASILADAMEAVIGAVYLDGGWTPAAALVMSRLVERIDAAASGPGVHDYKTRLQEAAARRTGELPVYDVRESGPDHAKHFHAVVRLGGVQVGEGEGRSKKTAQQQAARQAWDWLIARYGEDGGRFNRAGRTAPPPAAEPA